MATAEYTAEQIAAFFINKANHEYIDADIAEGVSNLKLQKLLDFA